jgi:hypothetical protein
VNVVMENGFRRVDLIADTYAIAPGRYALLVEGAEGSAELYELSSNQAAACYIKRQGADGRIEDAYIRVRIPAETREVVKSVWRAGKQGEGEWVHEARLVEVPAHVEHHFLAASLLDADRLLLGGHRLHVMAINRLFGRFGRNDWQAWGFRLLVRGLFVQKGLPASLADEFASGKVTDLGTGERWLGDKALRKAARLEKRAEKHLAEASKQAAKLVKEGKTEEAEALGRQARKQAAEMLAAAKDASLATEQTGRRSTLEDTLPARQASILVELVEYAEYAYSAELARYIDRALGIEWTRIDGQLVAYRVPGYQAASPKDLVRQILGKLGGQYSTPRHLLNPRNNQRQRFDRWNANRLGLGGSSPAGRALAGPSLSTVLHQDKGSGAQTTVADMVEASSGSLLAEILRQELWQTVDKALRSMKSDLQRRTLREYWDGTYANLSQSGLANMRASWGGSGQEEAKQAFLKALAGVLLTKAQSKALSLRERKAHAENWLLEYSAEIAKAEGSSRVNSLQATKNALRAKAAHNTELDEARRVLGGHTSEPRPDADPTGTK